MRPVSFLEAHTSETLIPQERKKHLQVLKRANPAQARPQKNQKVKRKAAMAPRVGNLLVHQLKANPTVKMAHRLQMGDLPVHQILDHKATLTARAEHLLQVAHRLRTQDLPVLRMVDPKATLIARAAQHLRTRDLPVHQILGHKAMRTARAALQEIRQQHLSSHRPSKVAHQKQGLPDQCRRLVPNLSRAGFLGRTFLS